MSQEIIGTSPLQDFITFPGPPEKVGIECPIVRTKMREQDVVQTFQSSSDAVRFPKR